MHQKCGTVLQSCETEFVYVADEKVDGEENANHVCCILNDLVKAHLRDGVKFLKT